MLNLGYVSNNLGFGGGQKTGHKPSLALLPFAGGEQTVDRGRYWPWVSFHFGENEQRKGSSFQEQLSQKIIRLQHKVGQE